MSRGTVLDSLKNKCLLLDETLDEIERDFATSSVKRDKNQMIEYLSEVLDKYSALCKTIQDIDEDLKKISTKVKQYEVTKFLNELKNKHEELEMSFKKQKAYLLTSKSLVEEPVGRLDATKVLDDAVNQYKKLREQFKKRSCLTGDIMILKSKMSIYGEEKGSFFRRVLNIVLNLWNKIVSFFSSSAGVKLSPNQNYEGVIVESEVKVESTKVVIEKKLEGASVDYAEQNERVGFKQSDQRGV